MEALDFGGEVWYSTELHEVPFSMASPQFMGTFLQRLGNQARILGWRRLGGGVILEFTEEEPKEPTAGPALFAPKAIVKVHIAVPAPRAALFASHIAHSALELVGCICTLALGRPVGLPHVICPAKEELWASLSERRGSPEVLTLARKSVPLDVMGWVARPGGFPSSSGCARHC